MKGLNDGVNHNYFIHCSSDRLRGLSDFEITENIVKTIFQHLNSQWERRGYEYLYNVTEDELNAYEFYEDGKIYGLE